MILAKVIHTYIGLMLKLVKRRRQKEEESEGRWNQKDGGTSWGSSG